MTVFEIIERETGQKVTPETRLENLDCDSLEYLDLLLTIERELGISQQEAQSFTHVRDFVR